MKTLRIPTAVLFFISAIFLSSCDKDGGDLQTPAEPPSNVGTLNLTVNNVVGNLPLVLGNEYPNARQDTFSIEQVQYFLSNVVLVRENGELVKIPDSYNLFTQSSSRNVHEKAIANVPSGSYRAIRFAVGVDSAKNGYNDGEGDLSAAESPLWDWNTGYKFVVVDGHYRSEGQQGGLLLHVGNDINYRILQFNFAAHNMENLMIANGRSSEIVFDFDLYSLFSSVHKINFKIDNDAMGGTLATHLADNYGNNTLKLKQVIN